MRCMKLDDCIFKLSGNPKDMEVAVNIEDMRKMSKEEKRALFFKSGGRMKLDTKAIYDMRERSMI